MDSKIVKNYLYNVLYTVLIVALPLFTSPYITRALGSVNYGINTAVSNEVQWFVFLGLLGVKFYGNREIAKVRDDKEKLSRTFFEIYAMQFITMGISIIMYILFILFGEKEFLILSFIQLITLLSVTIDITWFFFGVEDFKKVSIRNIFVKLIGVVLMFLFIKKPEDLTLFVFINATVGFFGQLIMWSQIKEYVTFERITVSGVIKHLKPNILLFVPQIAINVYTVSNITMIRLLYQENQNIVMDHIGFLNQAHTFVKMFLFFITSIGSVVLSRISNVNAVEKEENRSKEIKKILNPIFNFVLYLAIPMIFGICTVVPFFIPWFLDSTFYPVTGLIIILSPIILFISISDVYGTQYMLPIGLMKQYTFSVSFGAIINLIINIFLIPKYGAYGAAISTVITEFFIAFTQWMLIRKRISLRVSWTEIMKYIIASILMAVAVYYLGINMNFEGSGYLSFIKNLLQVIIGILVYSICSILFKAKIIYFFKEKILKMMKEK